MDAEGLEFTAMGTPATISRAIEQYTVGKGSLSAIVVPWESQAGSVSMAVTSTTGEGWAIEHANLGTIRLTDLGDGKTRVAIAAHGPQEGHPGQLVALFEAFSRQLRDKFLAVS
jgi:hypothetical protein